MKTHQLFSIFLLLFFVNKATAQLVKTVELQVTGLTCSMCSQATEKSLSTLPYIDKITPDLNRNVFVITFKKGSQVNFDQLQKKVKDAGFSVGKLEATFDFDQARIDENGQTSFGSQTYRFVNAKNKVLDGLIKTSLVDKNFISTAAYKQKLATVKFDSYATGMGQVNGKKTRIFHLSL
ncbi:MAG: cation transporter [Pedobacter sp.]|nr:cation transporter [Pedobacter sp.]MDQ8052490.1 cation transporter [Pedobacter sp.]